MTMVLRRATFTDIPFIMACERRPGYEPFVGRWSDEKHRAAMRDASFCYLIASDDVSLRGFAILHCSDMRPQNLYLKRVAVHDTDSGHGRRLLIALNDWVFSQTDTHRFWFETAENNHRARHVYESLGFVVEGIQREVYGEADGTRSSSVQMSLLKPEWQARRK